MRLNRSFVIDNVTHLLNEIQPVQVIEELDVPYRSSEVHRYC